MDELASALQLPADEFRAHYHFDQPAQEDVVIFMDRTNKKSYWAAQIARDAGWRHVYVYRAGVYGWRFDAGVLPYAEYQLVGSTVWYLIIWYRILPLCWL